MSIAFFTDTGVLNGEANGDGTLAIVISIVYHDRSRPVIHLGYGSYGDSYPAGPRYNSYLHLGV